MDLREYFLHKKIGVLAGGVSSEREVSLRSGNNVLDSLKRQGFKTFIIDPADNDFIEQIKVMDVAFIALHGGYGEDGSIQGLLEVMGIPYTGSGVLASALAMNKVASKRILREQGIPTPDYACFPWTDENVSSKLGLPLIAKPISEGSSVGVTIIRDESEIKGIIDELTDKYRDVFLEKYIHGQSVTVGILGNGKKMRALPILELVSKNEFYDYEAKYTSGMTEFIIPARLDADIYKTVCQTAINAHLILGCEGFSRVDILVADDGTPFVHDVNTIPGLTNLSDLPACAANDGMNYDELIFEMLCSAYYRGKITACGCRFTVHS
ncbi:D-alanine--D-alanine ligase [Candidatus Desantisbacteria bacterium]|nr:D-alanine--D-alanine ligase [Candidatus Desantisbacteria bacterium]